MICNVLSLNIGKQNDVSSSRLPKLPIIAIFCTKQTSNFACKVSFVVNFLVLLHIVEC